jgi:hypothetical protein
MSRYRKIPVNLWITADFLQLSDRAKLIYFYFLTNPNTNSIPGLYRLGEAQAADEIGMDVKGFREGYAELFRKGFAKGNWKARVMWLPMALEYNKPENPNVVKSWGDYIVEIPDCMEKVQSIQALERVCQTLSEGFRESFRKGFGNHLERVCRILITDTDTDTDTEHETETDTETTFDFELKKTEPKVLKAKERNLPSRKAQAVKPSQLVKEKYFELYRFVYGEYPIVWGLRENTQAKRLCESTSMDNIFKYLELFFSWKNSDVVKNGHSFCVGYNSFVVKLNELQAEINNPNRIAEVKIAEFQRRRRDTQQASAAVDEMRAQTAMELLKQGEIENATRTLVNN